MALAAALGWTGAWANHKKAPNYQEAPRCHDGLTA
jgi:FMN phosphatase YigB (HAD superfamily)